MTCHAAFGTVTLSFLSYGLSLFLYRTAMDCHCAHTEPRGNGRSDVAFMTCHVVIPTVTQAFPVKD